MSVRPGDATRAGPAAFQARGVDCAGRAVTALPGDEAAQGAELGECDVKGSDGAPAHCAPPVRQVAEGSSARASRAVGPSPEPRGAIGYVQSEPGRATRVREVMGPRYHVAMPVIRRLKKSRAWTDSEFGPVTNLCQNGLSDLQWFPALPEGALVCAACEKLRGRAAPA